ncbi:MAG: hypothetical protein ACRD93_02150 [Nitrososphaeraceae archaeon]
MPTIIGARRFTRKISNAIITIAGIIRMIIELTLRSKLIIT